MTPATGPVVGEGPLVGDDPVVGPGRLADVEAIIERGGSRLRTRMTRAEERLAAIAEEAVGPLARHASSTIAAGGKRLRPLLVFLAAEASGPVGDDPASGGNGGPAVGANGDAVGEQALVHAAVAVELVHSATLVHDDILDAADLRRGRPTVVASAGRDMAIATGDLLFSRAFAELARNGSAVQLSALSEASSALAEGELLQREDAYRVEVSLERYLLRCELKTARLFEAACRLGALAAPDDRADAVGNAPASPPGVVDALGAFARYIGLAFQLLDDVLDVSGPPERTGKPRGTDLLDGTVTLPLILAREQDRELAALDLRTLAGPRGRRDAVCGRIAGTGGACRGAPPGTGDGVQAKAQLPTDCPPPGARCSSWSPTASSNAIPEVGGRGPARRSSRAANRDSGA